MPLSTRQLLKGEFCYYRTVRRDDLRLGETFGRVLILERTVITSLLGKPKSVHGFCC